MREKDLQYVLDWIAIQELVAEYGQAIDYCRDSGEWARWVNVFTPMVTADYSRFLGSEPVTIEREKMAEIAKSALKGFSRTQHTTSTNVRIEFKSGTVAEVKAHSEAAHFFSVGGVPNEWTIVARYTHEVEKTSDGWKIRKVTLEPIHYRGNPVGLEMVQGKRLA